MTCIRSLPTGHAPASPDYMAQRAVPPWVHRDHRSLTCDGSRGTLDHECTRGASVSIDAVGFEMKRVFISYSRQDQVWVDRLRAHLEPLERQGLIELWDAS